jgi:hypothetical protein
MGSECPTGLVDAVVVVGFQIDELEQKRLDLLKVQIVAAGG